MNSLIVMFIACLAIAAFFIKSRADPSTLPEESGKLHEWRLVERFCYNTEHRYHNTYQCNKCRTLFHLRTTDHFADEANMELVLKQTTQLNCK